MIDAYETEVRRLATIDLDLGYDPNTYLLVGGADGPSMFVDGRDPGDRAPADHVSEMALLVASFWTPVVVLAVPSRLRDLDTGDVLTRNMVMTTVLRREDGVDMEADAFPFVAGERWQLGPTMALPAASSPVARLLHDACTRPVDLDPLDAILALLWWGHGILTRPSEDPVDVADLPDPSDTAGPARPSERGRYVATRLAREFQRLHHPLRPATRQRPAAPTNLPPGFVPACPL